MERPKRRKKTIMVPATSASLGPKSVGPVDMADVVRNPLVSPRQKVTTKKSMSCRFSCTKMA